MSKADRIYTDPNAIGDVWESIRGDETFVLRVACAYIFNIPTLTTEDNLEERGDRLAEVMDLLGFNVERGSLVIEGNDVTLERWGFALRDARPNVHEEA